ncbi:hypothetical protein Rpal_1508 [Rhodopseudomonas palustris TIE-1]|nr:hypothetical protein Rpal_1508 [Rhodopseudomonas palustris TIE-1]
MCTPKANCHSCRNQTCATDMPQHFSLVEARSDAAHRKCGPYTWWRVYTAEQNVPLASVIAAALDRLSATDPDLRAALHGDAILAVKLAINQQGRTTPFEILTDMVMTALMRCALNGSVAAAVVLANIIRSCRFDHQRGVRLAASWFAFPALLARPASKDLAEQPTSGDMLNDRGEDAEGLGGEGL